MELSNFQRLYDNVRMHATGSLLAGIQPELFETVRDFCDHTNAWNQTQDVVVTNASQDYTLTFPTGSAIKRLLAIQDITNGVQTPPIPVRWPVTMVLPSTMHLGAVLQNTYTWRVQTALVPIDPVDGNGDPMIPNWMVDNYFDAFFSGTLWRMMAQVGKPWSNGQMAATRYRLYMKSRGEAAAAVLAANVYNAQTWSYPRAGVTLGRQRGV